MLPKKKVYVPGISGGELDFGGWPIQSSFVFRNLYFEQVLLALGELRRDNLG